MKLTLFALFLAFALADITTQEVNKRQPKQLHHPYYYPYHDMDMLRAGLHYQYPTYYEPRFDVFKASSPANGQGRSGSRDSSSPITSELDQANLESDYNDAGRFFYGSNIGTGLSANSNFLIKTSYAFTTSTATVCSLISCIPADEFAAGSSNVLCRRRRDAAEILAIMQDAKDLEDEDISPSVVEDLEATKLVTLADPNFKPIPEGRQMEMSPHPIEIEPSMEKRGNDNHGQWNEQRQKRFAFILTTTVTSYELSTATYTVTVTAAGAGALSCRPSRFSVC